jgi:hypothetical protein
MYACHIIVLQNRLESFYRAIAACLLACCPLWDVYNTRSIWVGGIDLIDRNKHQVSGSQPGPLIIKITGPLLRIVGDGLQPGGSLAYYRAYNWFVGEILSADLVFLPDTTCVSAGSADSQPSFRGWSWQFLTSKPRSSQRLSSTCPVNTKEIIC